MRIDIMETVLVIDVIELYGIICGIIFLCLIGLWLLLCYLWDEHLSYFFYKLKRKFKKV